MTQKYSMEGVEDYDRASPRHHASQRAQPSRARYDQAKHNHRSTEAARYGDNRRGMERSHHGRSSHLQDFSSALLDDALHDLQSVLEIAVDFYASFVESFDRDIQLIRPYAGSRIMEHLWVNKVTLREGRIRTEGRAQARREEDSTLGRLTSSQTFQSISGEVNDCFRAAIESRTSSCESSSEAQSASRIRKKLEETYRDVFKLMRTALQQRADADALVTELELVLTLLEKTGPQRSRRDDRDNHKENKHEDYDKPNEDGQGGFEQGQGILPTT